MKKLSKKDVINLLDPQGVAELILELVIEKKNLNSYLFEIYIMILRSIVLGLTKLKE